MLIINAIVLNILSGAMLFALARMYERDGIDDAQGGRREAFLQHQLAETRAVAKPHSLLHPVYSVSVDQVLERIRMLIINAIVLNILSGAMLFALFQPLSVIFRRDKNAPLIHPRQRKQHRAAEDIENFNRKIVASAPVGICILRTLDGTNILSNELAHNYHCSCSSSR
jgi:hypothetical protein